MYRKLAGLSQLEPGYKRFQVKPMFVKGIEEWGTEFDSVYGKIVANTSCKNGMIHVHVEVPANTTAVIILPEKDEVHEVGAAPEARPMYEVVVNALNQQEKRKENG